MSSCIDDVYSHPNKKLDTHLLNVANNSKNIFKDLCIENNNFYANISFLIGLSHDFAKCTSFFQEYLFNHKVSEKAYHGFLSAIFGYYVVDNYLTKNNIDVSINYPIIAYICIKHHHGNLIDVYSKIGDDYHKIIDIPSYVTEQIKDIKINSLKNFRDFYLKYNISIDDFLKDFESITKTIKLDLKKFSREKSIENYLLLLEFFSVLIDSDKLDASYTEVFPRREIDSGIVDLYKDENFKNFDGINKIREDAYKNLLNSLDNIDLSNKIYSITLPTGSGKTLGVLSFSLKLRNKINKEYGFIPRIIYSLPFLSIIDQNEKVIKDVLAELNYNTSDIFIKHNSMSEIYYTIRDEDKNEFIVDNAEMLIESWYSEIIITTFYQLFYTIFTNKNKSLKKFHNISNSIIILDEIQSIPPKYWSLIRLILKDFSKKFNVWIIFMTATQPAIFNENEITPLIDDENKYFNYFDRINYKFYNSPINISDFIDELENIIFESDKDIMFVLNTIQSSLDIYNKIKLIIDDSIELYYLSTNITPKERLDRINSIKNSNNRKIIVTTQLIEAGVDIDVDIIYRDFTTIDSIIQTGGRCNRNGKKGKGIVNIIRLTNENGREYSRFIYDSTLLGLTEELTKDFDIVPEKEFNLSVSKKYFAELKSRVSSDSSSKIIELIEKIKISNITNDFKLIEENIEKEDVFVDLNGESSKIWLKYIELYSNNNLTNFEKRREFNKFKNSFKNYVISVDVKKLGTTNLEPINGMFYISHDDLDRKYDSDTGFLSQDEENAFII